MGFEINCSDDVELKVSDKFMKDGLIGMRKVGILGYLSYETNYNLIYNLVSVLCSILDNEFRKHLNFCLKTIRMALGTFYKKNINEI